jgi:general L-amino acid transport system substrate-binding protein
MFHFLNVKRCIQFAVSALHKNFLLYLFLGTMSISSLAFAGKTLDQIKQKDTLTCGVNTGLAGFAQADSQGKWSGLDVDICRALAAAVLGNPNKVKYVPLSAPQRFTALQSGEVDILSRNTTFTLTRDTSLGLSQTVVTFFDGQAFMVPSQSNIKSAKQLKGATVCVQSGTTTEKNLTDFSKANKLDIKPIVFEKLEAANAAYFSGRCKAYTTDASGLASIRSKEAKNPKDHTILGEFISKEPMGPLVRRGDEDWLAVVRWVIYGLIEAEEYGVSSTNVEEMRTDSQDPKILRMLGKTEDMGKLIGLDKEWLYRAVLASGNYGEIFERNLGEKTSLGLKRGLNNQWTKGGLMYAVPIR